jgi:hypothetical protein
MDPYSYLLNKLYLTKIGLVPEELYNYLGKYLISSESCSEG